MDSGLLLALLGAIFALWLRLEHRLTRVETLLGILNGRR